MGFVERFMEIQNNAQEMENECNNIEQLTEDEKKLLQPKRDALFKDWCPYKDSFDRCEDSRCLCKEESGDRI